MDAVPSGPCGRIRGAGVGLRSAHYQVLEETRPDLPWLEVLTDNYLGEGGPPLQHLARIARHYPVVLHGVGLSVGSTDALDGAYLARVRRLAEQVDASWVSDHLCWTSQGGEHLHELLPLPYTAEALAHVCSRIVQAREALGRPFLVENVSSYLQLEGEMPEWEFVAEVARRSGCGLLLDVNNVYVSAVNHGFDPVRYLDALPRDSVWQMHLAGYEDRGGFLLDTHGARVSSAVWALYAQALQRFGPVPTCIEWDTDVPAFEVLQAEAQACRSLMEAAHAPAR